MNNIKQHFEQNMLDGDEVQDSGQMLNTSSVLEYIEEYYTLKPIDIELASDEDILNWAHGEIKEYQKLIELVRGDTKEQEEK